MTTTESVKVVDVTPTVAKQWLGEFKYHAQRPVKKQMVDYYAREMESGRFKDLTTIEVCRFNGSKHLIDGQHRLMAVVESNKPHRFVILEVATNSQEELDYRYAQTDRGLQRNVNDQYKALSLPEEFGLPEMYTNALGSSVMFIRENFDRNMNRGVSLEERLALMREYAIYAAYYYEVVAGAPTEMGHTLRRVSTLSVALVTFRYSAEKYGTDKVESFWYGVATDDGLFSADARKVAHRHLLQVGIVGGAHTSNYARRASSQESSRYLARCFNAFVENRPAKRVHVVASNPIVIAGSPFNGKQTSKVAA